MRISLIPSIHMKKVRHNSVCLPSQCQEGRHRKIPRACWPGSIAKLSNVSERHCLRKKKKKDRKQLGKIAISTTSAHPSTFVHPHMCTHSWTNTKRKQQYKANKIKQNYRGILPLGWGRGFRGNGGVMHYPHFYIFTWEGTTNADQKYQYPLRYY